jgi:hypothetical protein
LSTRPELTWAGDEAIRPGLDAATTDLEAMTADIDRLGGLGRGALAALAGSKWDVLDAAVADGAVLVAAIRDRPVRDSAHHHALEHGLASDRRVTTAGKPAVGHPDGAFHGFRLKGLSAHGNRPDSSRVALPWYWPEGGAK